VKGLTTGSMGVSGAEVSRMFVKEAETIVITGDGARRMHSFSTDFQQLPA
jgi:hypothetical protein